MGVIHFISDNNNSINEFCPAKTLINFIEYDYSIFYEKAKALYENNSADSLRSHNAEISLIKMIASSHPFINSLVKKDFSSLVIDAYIYSLCKKLNTDEVLLWNRYLDYAMKIDKRIFKRLSEIKNCKSVNMYRVIKNAQKYAFKKAQFIFGDNNLQKSGLNYRQMYFDLLMNIASSEAGIPENEHKFAEKLMITSIPESFFTLKQSSKIIYNSYKKELKSVPYLKDININKNNFEEKFYEAIKDLNPLDDNGSAISTAIHDEFCKHPKYIYKIPNLKSAVDLEISEMITSDIIIKKCKNCGKFFETKISDASIYCNRVNSTGLTCTEQFSPKQEIKSSTDILDKCEEVYLELFKKAGNEISNNEFYEWADYLGALRDKYREKEVSDTDIIEFLEKSKAMYKC